MFFNFFTLSNPGSTLKWVRIFENWYDENVLEKNPETVRPEQLDKVLERFFACVCKQYGTDHDCEHNLSPMILKGKTEAQEIIRILTKRK